MKNTMQSATFSVGASEIAGAINRLGLADYVVAVTGSPSGHVVLFRMPQDLAQHLHEKYQNLFKSPPTEAVEDYQQTVFNKRAKVQI